MKQDKIFTLLMALGLGSLVSCNNSSNATAGNDSTITSPDVSATTTTTTSDNTAYADAIEKNSAAGNYINPRTGKPYGKLTVNRNTGEITDENNEPVWRYVDKRTWWVYGVDDDWNWVKLDQAKMDKDQLLYRDENGNWVTYDKRWPTNDESLNKTWKARSGDAKIKFGKDGDIKYKDDSVRVKYNAGKDQIKVDTSK